MRIKKVIIIAICFIFSIVGNARTTLLINALDTLDNVLLHQTDILRLRSERVDSLKKEAYINNFEAKKVLELASQYQGLDNDSSIHYYNIAIRRARETGDTATYRSAISLKSERLAKASRFRDAFETLDTLDISSWGIRQKMLYFSMMSHIAVDAAAYRNFAYRRGDYVDRAVASLDSLQNILAGRPEVSLVNAQRYFLENQPTLAIGELNEIFGDADPFSPEYAVMANMLASYYEGKPDHVDEYIYYLTLSAISDARRGNGEAVSLANLGEELLRRGDSERAFHYLTVAGERIADSHTNLYGAEFASPLTRFARVWVEREAKARRGFVITIVVLAVLLIGMIIYIWLERRKQRAQRVHSQKLADSLINRDHYINQLLNLCGVYVEGLEEYNRLVARKLRVNQVQDLYRTIESGKMLQEQTDRFFEVFDDAISKIFPNFVEEVNALLLPDKQVSALPGGRLSPELRIIAFMRLGITDSTRLSKFLGLSVNTIYTYRNRMKSRAKNREMFETNITQCSSL